MDQPTWWQTGVIYQIYPRSFADADGDGVGDLRGIVDRLDHVTALGVDAIWLSPIYPSPMADFGYDVADYVDVDPLFGTLADFDALVAAAHDRGLRVILDLVPNHTSDEHPWFVDSRASRASARRDWYIWRDARPDGSPPNNWQSYFGGPAWEWDEHTGQYYLHLFHAKQPDLDWRNPAVRRAMDDVMRFWFDRGVDGFRIDVLWMLIKDEALPDDPPATPRSADLSHWSTYSHPGYEDRPEVHEIVRAMRAVADEYDARVLIGEIYLPLERLVRYYGDDLRGIHLPFNFGLVTLPAWEASAIRHLVAAYEAALPAGAWPNWVLGNHDVPRIATRAGEAGSRVAQLLLLTLRGTPTCYYGDELGMVDGVIPPERAVDPQAADGRGRDAARTPMQWSPGPGAGFCAPGVEPWLPIPTSAETRNVAVQAADPRSHLALVRRLLALRRAHAALTVGSLDLVDAPGDVVAYVRTAGDERVLVVANLGPSPARVDAAHLGRRGEILCATGLDRSGPVDLAAVDVRAHEGVVVAVA
jgi:alpha-glucosidase